MFNLLRLMLAMIVSVFIVGTALAQESDTGSSSTVAAPVVPDDLSPEQVDEGLEALANRHGWAKVRDAIERLSKNA